MLTGVEKPDSQPERLRDSQPERLRDRLDHSHGPTRRQQGVTMIELAVVVAIIAILASLALPSFSSWIQNSQVRNAAEAIQNGLRLARAEAVRRNTPVRFQLTSTVDADCVLSTVAANWVISVGDPTGGCATGLVNEAFPLSDFVNNPLPQIIQKHAASEGSRNALVAAGQSSVIFNGAGRVTPMAAANIDISNPTGGACSAAAGPIRCLRVAISSAGQIRMCEPGLASADPRSC